MKYRSKSYAFSGLASLFGLDFDIDLALNEEKEIDFSATVTASDGKVTLASIIPVLKNHEVCKYVSFFLCL